MIVVTIAPATAAIETKAAAFGLSTLDVFLVSVTTTRKYSRNLGQRSIMVRKGTFFEKGPQKLHPSPPPYLIPFLTAFYQNKASYNLHKWEQRSIVECNIGLE